MKLCPNGVPGPWESTHLVAPGMRALLQRHRIHPGEVVGPIRDVYWARSSDPAARKDTDLSDPFAHHPAQDRELHLWVLGVQAHRVADGVSGLSSSRQSPRLGDGGLPVRARHLGAPHQSPPPLAWGSLSDPADLPGGPPERDSYPAR